MAKTAVMKVWNVELGLAVHIKAPNGRFVVIDLGSTQGVSPIQDLWFRKVGYMVITHPHHDHISDIQNVDYADPKVLWRVRDYTREELLEGVSEQDKADFEKYCDLDDRYNGSVSLEEKPETGNPFDGMTVKVFRAYNCGKDNKNNLSGIVVVTLGNVKVIVCGDNEEDSFKELMQKQEFKDAVKEALVLVAPHHGRESGYCEEFVTLVSPFITIISDTKKGETSVSEKYSDKSSGWNVWKEGENSPTFRKCLTTRSDGNIEVEFGESDDPNKIGRLTVTVGVR